MRGSMGKYEYIKDGVENYDEKMEKYLSKK